jgi:two-component system, NtrC family, nitrogen regulation response regulator NtrX
MARMDGLEALTRIREHDPSAVVIMISGHGTIDTAVEATRRGAYDFLEKPLDTDRLLLVLRNALQQQGLVQENQRLRGEIESRHQIVGRGFALRQVLDRVEKVAPTDARVLITGENGTGKELIARAIHRLSAARREAVRGGELRRHPLGADRVGALRPHEGLLHRRARGPRRQVRAGRRRHLFLDEIGDMSLQAQAKVLRALQEGIVTRVGGAKPIQVDVRVLAATNKDLEAEIARALPRGPVLPAQRDPAARPAAAGAARGRPHAGAALRGELRPRGQPAPAPLHRRGAGADAADGLARQRARAAQHGGAAADPGRRRRRHRGRRGAAGGRAMKGGGLSSDLLACQTFAEFKEAAERAFILQKLRENDWNVSETARLLDMPRSNLYKKIERYELVREG